MVGWLLTDTANALSFVVPAYAAMFAVMGFGAGAVFSGVLRAVEGRRTFDELSLGRFTMWGAFGGILLAGGMIATGGAGAVTGVIGVGLMALLGAGSAAGTLALARRPVDAHFPKVGQGEPAPGEGTLGPGNSR